MTQVSKRKGRPLSFDRDEALRKAMILFWTHGYEATSLADITATLGIKPSSVYTAFGDKKSLFLDAVRLYLSGPVTFETIVDGAASAHEAASELLRVAAMGFTGTDTPPGCLLASAAASCSEDAADVKEALSSIRQSMQGRLRQKIVQSMQSGELPSDTNADALAAMTMAVIQGMSTLARDGAVRETLIGVADMAMRCWPSERDGKR